MQRYFRRSYKRDKITFLYEFPAEIFCNQSFLRGSLIVPTTDTFTIECWSLFSNNLNASTPSSTPWYRKEEKDGDGNITDNYAVIEYGSGSAIDFMKSQGILLNKNDTLEIGFDVRSNQTGGGFNARLAAVQLVTATQYWNMDDDGVWYLSNSSWSVNRKFLNMSWSSAEKGTDWKNITVKSKAIPDQGTIYILLVNYKGTSGYIANFKGLEFTIREASKQPGVIGDYDQYERTNTVKQNFEEQTYLDDSNNRQHKGALHFSGDLTGDNWYRDTFNTERLTFKRQKAIAHMLLDRRTRLKLDVNMLGLTYMDGATERMIGLMNRFRFVDDAPDKLFMILNLKEMDFVAGTWQATLLEVWDDVQDSDDDGDYPPHSYGNIYQSG